MIMTSLYEILIDVEVCGKCAIGCKLGDKIAVDALYVEARLCNASFRQSSCL